MTEMETIMRFLGYTLGDESAMPTEPPSPGQYEAMDAFVEEAVKAGVIVAHGRDRTDRYGGEGHAEGW